MSFSPADSSLHAALFTDPELGPLFSDEALLGRCLEFESALARVQGRLGAIPEAAAARIAEALAATLPASLDLQRLAADAARDGVVVPGLVRQLRERLAVGDGADAADHLHYGATSQDVLDTALALQLKAALPLLRSRLTATVAALADLAREHRDTPMVGRTHGRQAVPITFGLKCAAWLAPLLRHDQRLAELEGRVLVVQLGGAAGTLAPLGDRGPRVRAALAAELGLGATPVAWHAQRDGLVELAAWLANVSGSLAKLAQDVILLSAEEVGEVAVASDRGEPGGSSTMPQKRNPIRCELIVAAARACAAAAGSMQHAAVQEHERGTHGWHLEWTALPQLVAYCGGALAKAADLALDLRPEPQRMLANLTATRGLVLAESLAFALARHAGRSAAARLVAEAVQAVASGEAPDLISAARRLTDAPLDWDDLADPTRATGSASAQVDELLAQVAARAQRGQA